MGKVIDIFKTIALVCITKYGPMLTLIFSLIVFIFLFVTLIVSEALFIERAELEKSEQTEEYSLPKFEECDVVSVDGILYTLKCE